MENKKTFGEYICNRRKEMGMTQKEFAGKLYVTESAVSKWERGMSYPDVTLLRDICTVLEVSEHELLTASVDTEKRTVERLAEKYLRLTKTYRIILCVLFVGTLLSCGIVNIVSWRSWFPIVLAAVALAASLTLLPSLLEGCQKLSGCKWSISLGSAVACLELLLLFCALLEGSSLLYGWFSITAACILFGAGLVLLPFLLPTLPLPPCLTCRKASLYCGVETALLLLIFAAAARGNWDFFCIAATAVLFGVGFFTTPVYLWQLPLPEAVRKCKASLYIGVQTLLLFLLLLAVQLISYSHWWFPITAISIILVLSVVFLPILLRQLPLPEKLRQHKALLYFSIVSVLLLALLSVISYYTGGQWLFAEGIPLALTGLTLPWGLMGIIRYLPLSGWFRGALSSAWIGLWGWLYPWVVDKIEILNGYYYSIPYTLRLPFDFSRWDTAYYVSWNTVTLVLASFGLLAATLAAVGIFHEVQRHRK